MKKKNGKARVFFKLISCFSLERERERKVFVRQICFGFGAFYGTFNNYYYFTWICF